MGEWIDPRDPAGTCEVKLTLEQAQTDALQPQVTGRIEWKLDDGTVEQESFVFCRSNPDFELIQDLCTVRLLWFDTRFFIGGSDNRRKSPSFNDFVFCLGFDADKSIRIVRHDAVNKRDK